MDEEVVNRFLKTSRKARKQATCYPCQRRKVKCDRGSPCKVCVARGHSFLCAYGRQSDGPVTTPSDVSATKELSDTISDDSVPVDASDVSVLRKELDKLRREVHRTRTRHRRCQATQIESRRLRARCKEYEVIYTSLRAGDRTALSKLDKMMDNDIDTDGDAASSSQSQDGSEAANRGSIDGTELPIRDEHTTDHGAQNSFMRRPEAMQHREVRVCSPSGQYRRKPFMSSQNMAVGMRNLRLTQNLANEASNHTASLNQSVSSVSSVPIQEDYDVTNGVLRVLKPSLADCGLGSHPIVTKVPDQHPRISPSAFSDAFFHMNSSYQSTAGVNPSKHTETIPVTPPGPQCSTVVENLNVTQSLLIPPSMKVLPDSFWIHDTSYPPMAFTQCTDLMERSYADYCSRILTNSLP